MKDTFNLNLKRPSADLIEKIRSRGSLGGRNLYESDADTCCSSENSPPNFYLNRVLGKAIDAGRRMRKNRAQVHVLLQEFDVEKIWSKEEI